MSCKKAVFCFWVFSISLLFFQAPRSLWGAPTRDPARDPSLNPTWEPIEREAARLLKRYPEKEFLSEGASPLDQARFYLNAGLWSAAERTLAGVPQREGRRLLLILYARRGEYESIFAAFREAPALFAGQSGLRVAAAQGALIQKSYSEALTLLRPIPPASRWTPARIYLSALAEWGERDLTSFHQTLEEGVHWAEEHPESPWASRLVLLNGYNHLSRKEYDLAFESLGRLFNQNSFVDLAFLGLGWGYFEMSSLEDLLGAFQGFEEGQAESPYSGRFFQMLTRLQAERGDLAGAIETDQRERAQLRQQIEALERKGQMIRKGEIDPVSIPPGSLLKKTLLRLQEKVGPQKEIGALLRQIDLWGQEKRLASLKEWERTLQKEEERLQARITRRCLAIGLGPSPSDRKEEGNNSLYLQAREAARRGKPEEVEASLKRLLAQGPGPYAEESAFRLGDLAFERGDYPAAISYYAPLLARPDAYLYRWALYKSAWAAYLQGEPKKAVPLLFREREALDRRREGPCAGSEAAKERRDDLRLLSLLLQREGGPAELVHWVEGKSPQENLPLFLDLAQYYESTGQKKEMAQTFESWIAAYPLFAETPSVHQAMIDGAARLNPSGAPDLLAARISFVECYRPESPWARNNGPEASQKVAPLIRRNLRALMAHFHQEAKKADRIALYQKAIPWYQLYLQLFPAERETGEVHLLYGELLSAMKNEKEAAAAYRASAYEDPPHPLSAEAGYREVVALEKIYPPSDPNLWEGYARFIQGFPSDPRVAQIYLKQAELAFEEGDYDKSRQFAEAISSKGSGQDCPKESPKNCGEGGRLRSALTWTAQRLIAQGYLKEKEYAKAVDFLKEVLSRPSAAEAPAKEVEEARALLALSYYQEGETLKRAGRSIDAAGAYWEAYQGGAETELGPLALFEAASLWGSASEQAKSEEALRTFRQRYPQSALYHPALLRLASLYEESNRPLEAAEVYEEAGRLKIDSALSLQALGRAIALYQKMEKWEKVSLLAAQTVERSHGEKQIEGIVIGAEAQMKLGRVKVAQKTLTDLLRGSRQKGSKRSASEEGAFYIAKAHLLLADSEIQQFGEIRLVAPLERNLQKKKALFDRLLREYGEAADAPAPALALPATHRMGEVLEEFSRALLGSERPKNLSKEERETYEALLKEQALPYLQRAEAAYQRNVDWGKKAGVENEWVARSAERLRRIHQQVDSLRSIEEGLKG